ncbi:hypothetical protein ALC53_10552 [Atta colombica]|uniref:Uncharacterized protein n=1 Tax=Atta colombica TaxID=520822 RepID=A0A195B3C7_9HYME|nr:hypothetical protein ALC53_10552 [Atta colombica]
MQIGDKGENNVDVFMHDIFMHVGHQARTRTFPPAPRFLSTLQVLVRGCFLEVAGDRGKGRGRNDIEEREGYREKIKEEK